MASRTQDEAAARLAAAASYALGVSTEDVIGGTRGSRTEAFIRQIAMYLCHVTAGPKSGAARSANGQERAMAARCDAMARSKCCA